MSKKGSKDSDAKNGKNEDREDKREDNRENNRENELENQLKQALSDYHNLKREMDKRLDFEQMMIRKDLVNQVIGLADDIDMALDHTEDEKGWREGVSAILEKFHGVISDLGAEIIETKPGDKFDTDMHEAVGVVSAGVQKKDDGKVTKIVQNGYKIGDVVIRPVRVIVNKFNQNQNE